MIHTSTIEYYLENGFVSAVISLCVVLFICIPIFMLLVWCTVNACHQSTQEHLSCLFGGIDDEWIYGARKVSFALNRNVWKCYNCFNSSNCMIFKRKCSKCGIGIHPFYFCIKNKNYDKNYPILQKKFGLIHHTNDTKDKINYNFNEKFNVLLLQLNQSEKVLFVCENGTEYDLQVVMFNYAIYHIFGATSHLYEIMPSALAQLEYDVNKGNGSVSSYEREIDINSRCTLPFRCKCPIVVTGHCDDERQEGNPINTEINADELFVTRENNVNDLSYSNISQYYGEKSFVKNLQCAVGLNLLFELVNEVIKNGYENALLPVEGQIGKHEEEYNGVERLYYKYKIFDILFEKMNHPKHIKMGKPLSRFPALLLGLILYCGDVCGSDLCLSLRNKNFKKWKVFSQCVESGIFILSKFEQFKNVMFYSGICNTFLTSFGGNHLLRATFSHPMSFTRNLHVAMKFRGSEGLIIGFGCNNSADYNFCMASVDWISSFPDEKEVLFVSVPFNIGQKQCITDVANRQQWISLTSECNVQEVFSHLQFETLRNSYIIENGDDFRFADNDPILNHFYF